MKPSLTLLLAGALAFVQYGCRPNEHLNPQTGTTENAGPNFRTPDWTDASHGKATRPDYATVFPQQAVNTLEIRLADGDWEKMKGNVKSLIGVDFGAGVGPNRPFPPNGQNPPNGMFPVDSALNPINSGKEPDYAAVSMKFNGKEWYKVGFRLKGNSSLAAAWAQGVYKLPFRLNMDRYETTYRQIDDQRFYGFKELSLSPGYSDNSLIREKVTADIFRKAGIPAAQTAFYKVYIDFGDGNGLKYCGVYTMVEVIDDTMVYSQFGEKRSNIYKPESDFQQFRKEAFEKKNNETAADWSDVQAAVAALNSPDRTTNPAQWRANLEKTFNVSHFLKWLAVNTAIVNWDTYGALAHNYYLYNSPTHQLTWIPWDHNMSMSGPTEMPGGAKPFPGGPGGPGGNIPNPGGNNPNPGVIRTFNGGVSLALSEVKANWPLIRYLADDPVYYARYKAYMKEFMSQVFTPAAMNSLFDQYSNLIAPYVAGAEPEQPRYSYLTNRADFPAELNNLKQHVVKRNQEVADFLK